MTTDQTKQKKYNFMANLATMLKKITAFKKNGDVQKKNLAEKIKNKGDKQISVLRMISILLIFSLLALFFTTIMFVYQSVITTIDQIQSIVIYQNAIVVDLIDFNRLNQVEKEWNHKLNTPLEAIKRNPFEPVAGSEAPLNSEVE